MNNKPNINFAGIILGIICLALGITLVVFRSDSIWPIIGSLEISGKVLGYISIGFGVINIILDIVETLYSRKK